MKIVNLDARKKAEENLYSKDIATLLVYMYPDAMTDGTFDDKEATRKMLEQYFSLISIEEAKAIVMEAYKQNKGDDT